MSENDINDEGESLEVVAGTAEPDVDIEAAAKEAGLSAEAVAEQFGDDAPAAVPVEPDEDGDRRATAAYAGWAYLAFLFALFLALALLAYGCDSDDDDSEAVASVTTTIEVAADELTPVALEFVVDGDLVTLNGVVPDAGAQSQLVDLAVARFGDGNVVDALTIDADTTLTDGTLSITGSTIVGDEDPEGLQADVAAALGVSAGDFDVAFEEVELTPIDVEANVATDKVALSGVVPDQATVDGMIEAAEGIWGEGNVDGAGLTVDPLFTLAGGAVRVTGVTDAGDTRVGQFAAAAESAFGVTIANGVEVDSSAEALGRLEARLKEELAADPILFATGSADIDPASDEILVTAAAAINAAPGISVEVVGHTDDQGAAGANQELSEARAQAVLDRLVELGVDADRLAARGAGEDEPVDDNETAEGRAANRRIAFEFEGAADS
ncbi:MAG: OOP family OmpA-OmpF porin [Acidimicrobiales bacterium]|jgi:OOP family OmpA-OmpF porin